MKIKSWGWFKKKTNISFRHILVDSILIVTSFYLSLWLRLGSNFSADSPHLQVLNYFVPLFLLLRLLSLKFFHAYEAIWRHISSFDAWNIVKAISLSTLLFFAASYVFIDLGRLPRSFFFIDALLVTGLLMGVRLFRRSLYEWLEAHSKTNPPHIKRLLIFGAGSNGRYLAQKIQSDPSSGYFIEGFIDDDEEKQNKRISGVKVLGPLNELPSWIEKTQATDVIIAIPSPPGELVKKVIELSRPYNISPQIISNFKMGGEFQKNIELSRQINLNDLLSRHPAQIDLTAIHKLIKEKVVLVTGAGGSIGSELARQVLQNEPQKLLLLDHSEYNLYKIDKELRISANDVHRIVPLLIDIKDKSSLQLVFQEHLPDIVFHAAAYKHVHLVESNPFSAILNNICGTKNLLDLSLSLERFVLISTDKAVNPAGIMGATKRVCELLTSAYAKKYQKNFCSVRFGNVLGSSGSLIPLLQKQIEEGGPITITHKDMTRYFMLIPEAVSLVLMAATIASPGDINVLKMGEPVKILDIAKNLITLMGKKEDEIEILFTGLRPGEKMFEELYIRGDELQTEHPDVLVLPNGDRQWMNFEKEFKTLCEKVEKMISAAQKGDKSAIILLNEIVKSNYNKPMPAGSILGNINSKDC